MTDVAIIASATGSVPRDYTIPGAQEILPKSVSASMDGTSAASSWFPTLEVLDPAGHVMFSALASSPVAAGASADVSWFRGLTQIPSSSAVLPGTGVDRHVTAQTITTNTAAPVSFDTALFDDLGWWSPLDPTKITVNLPGQFLCIYTFAWQYPGAGGFPIQTAIDYNAGVRVIVSEQSTAVAGTPNAHTGAAVVNSNAGDVFTLIGYQNSGGNMLTWVAGSAGPDVQPFPTLTVIRIGDRV